MRLAIALAFAALAACSESRGVSAEREYDVVKASGPTSAELCAAASRAADAWLKEQNQGKFQEWKVRRDLDCNQAALDRL